MSERSWRDSISWGLTLAVILSFVFIHLKVMRLKRAESALYSFINRLDRGDFAQAGKNIDFALSVSPQNAHYLSNRALMQERMLQRKFQFEQFKTPTLNEIEKTNIESAIADYQTVIRLNPYDDFAYHNLGWLYWLIQQKPDAIACLEKANAIDHSVPVYHVSLGLIREYLGNLTGAYQEYAEALRQSPALLDSRFFLDLRQRAPGDAERLLAEAIAITEAELQKSPSPIIKARLAKLYLHSQPDKAFPLLRDATIELPNLYRSWFNLGYWYETHQDWEQMEQCYKKSVFLNSWEIQPLYRLGQYYERTQRPEEAIRSYRGAINGQFNRSSVHSTRVRRIYVSNFTIQDDVMPKGLLQYTSPEFDIAFVCNRLAELYQKAGNERQSAYYRNLMDGAATKFVQP